MKDKRLKAGGWLMYAAYTVAVGELAGLGPFCVCLVPPAGVGLLYARRWHYQRFRVTQADRRFLNGRASMPRRRALLKGKRR